MNGMRSETPTLLLLNKSDELTNDILIIVPRKKFEKFEKTGKSTRRILPITLH